ncbi:MAG TPA: bifunctional metallophosphatase/5'-nucleotidase [Fredinandcohnia sp.]|nr:bifunctional metallophosphatase/5'-nucleotidase [Fredinandcohnia sp.]
MMLRRFLVSLALLSTACRGDPLGGQAAQPSTRHVTILFAADLHAQLEEHDELFWHGEERIERAGGFARLAKAIRQIRAERGGAVLAIDGGDTIQGSAAAAWTEGRAVVPALNAVGFDLGIPGNWEVVYGPGTLRARAAEIRHPLVAANLHDAVTGERLFSPWVIREVGGVRIGVIGYTDPDVPLRQPPAYSEGLAYRGPEELSALAAEVREAGAEVVLLVSHIGLARALALTEEVEGIDVHLSSDTHERTYTPIDRKGVWVVEPGAFGSFLGRLDLWVREGEIVDRRWELVELTARRFDEDEEVKAIVEQSLAPLRDRLDRPVGRTEVPLTRYSVLETNLDNFLADALRAVAGTDIALSNGFRFGTPTGPGTLHEEDLWTFYPISTPLLVGEVTGAQLLAFWEQEIENALSPDYRKRFGGWLPRPSGMTVRFEAEAPYGRRVREIRVHGEPLDPARTYTVAACLREGDAPDTLCRIRGAKNVRRLEIDAHEAVRRFLARNPFVRPQLEGRVVAEDLPRVLRSQIRELF